MWKQVFIALLGICLAYWFLSSQDDKLHTLKGKRVLVTGSSEGIGEFIAYHYARLGANVVVTARRLEKLNLVVKKCQEVSPSPKQTHFALAADMANLEGTKKVIEQAVKHLGGLDILVLNHAKMTKRVAFKSKKEDMDLLFSMMDINFRAYVHLTSHALPHMLANNGSIIVVNSLAGKIPQALYPGYCAAKGALNGFFHSLRNQFVFLKQNVSVTSCTLGLIDTESLKDRMDQQERDLLYSNVKAESPTETALDIVKGGAQRLDDVYTPYFATRAPSIVYSFWPEAMDYLSRRNIPEKEW